ncbi:uncharacterized protein MELLADRAFT_115766 [Melampsora larici-populina 98AG31]|uniref:Cysteine-rich transmembrane CYSTM domain-containing protein n=1 Tax=Melampsora larici-populina (strain 98AG31 / pathotype 3-4-7) TaxID=747676 RepID=F4RDX0_MELLP|nr:uncharacterized protein MELLADRAFT_115766 [Melampsora larici-populina 98AG31]EGG09536.1 hypothetical protein MELLADRAFT_115766 [Melampsora larici-populina 98AG31]
MNQADSTTISIPPPPMINSEHQLEDQEPKFPPTAYVLNQTNYIKPSSTNHDLDLERQDQSDEPKQDRLMRLRGGCCCDCLYDLIRCLLCCCIFEAICDMCC